jgi:hypothetical protein
MDLTFNVADLLGDNFDARRTRVWLETNIPDGVIVDSSGNEIRLGTSTAEVGADGTGIFEGVMPTNAATNPTAFQYRFHADYPDRNAPKGRGQWSSGWFSQTVTADISDLAAEVATPPTYASTLMTQLDDYAASLEPSLGAYVTSAETARDDAGDSAEAANGSASAAAGSAASAAESEQAAYDLVLSDLGTSDGQLTAIDGNAASDYRVQSDARLAATFVGLAAAATATAATDTANLQATLTASATTRQRLPKGVYHINAALTIPSGADVDFGGATIRRATGAGVFNMLTATGASNIALRNLIIDGNKDADTLVAETSGHRFGGLIFDTVTDSLLENVTVTGTVNNELTAGIYLDTCSDIVARNVNGYSNDRTAILVWESTRVTIDGSYTHDNEGSGVSSYLSPECSYLNIVTHDNGYSNLSVNGLRCRVSNVLTYGSTMSGLNIGHTTQASDDTTVSGVQSYGNTLDGITITGSARVVVLNFECHGNTRNNILATTGASACRFANGTSRDSAGGQGLYFQYGDGHQVSNVSIFGNAVSGVNIATTASRVTLQGVKVYNNGQVTSANSAGIIVNSTTLCKVVGCDAFDDQGTKTQESGIWLAGGSNHIVTATYVPTNKTYGLRQTSSPTGIVTANNITA